MPPGIQLGSIRYARPLSATQQNANSVRMTSIFSRMYSPVVCCTVLICVTSMSCYSASRGIESAPNEMVGLYERGYEPRGFRLCSDTASGGNWHKVQFQPGVKTNGTGTRTTDRSRLVTIVRWRAKIAPPGSTGPVGWPQPVIVEKVIDERAPQIGECGWDGV